jgi:predicted MFS family arabinose efflux permease
VTVLLPTAANFAAGAALIGVLVLYAQNVLGLGAVGFGVLLTAGGVGGIAGVLAAPVLGRVVAPHRSLAAIVAVAAAALVGMAVAPNAWWGGTASRWCQAASARPPSSTCHCGKRSSQPISAVASPASPDGWVPPVTR